MSETNLMTSLETNASSKTKYSFTDFFNRRLITVLLLGFASGLPLALSGATLQAWYTVAGVPLVTIGILSLVGQPYVFKFLWAPIFDRFIPPLLGKRRGWIFLLQFVLALTLFVMGLLNPASQTLTLALFALLLAFFSSTQDINIDAYGTELLQNKERGLGAAIKTGGYRIAMLVSGGLALMLAAKIGWRSTYWIMSALMLFTAMVTWTAPEPELKTQVHPLSLRQAVIDPFKEFFSRRSALLILLFIVLYKLTDALAQALGTTFLIRDLGFSLMDVGAIYKTVGMGATLIGSFVSGLLMIRLGLYRSLMLFGILQGISNLAFMILAIHGKSYPLMINAILLESLFSGMGTTALVAFLMAICDVRFTATQFALLSAFAVIGRVFTGPLAAVFVDHWGWATFYFLTVVIALPSLFLLYAMRNSLEIFKTP